MPDTKITALAAITTVDPAADVLPIVDISDTSMAASGTTKKITSNQILGAGGTATLASATITGDLTVDTSTLKVDSANNCVGIGTTTPNSYPVAPNLVVQTATNGGITIRTGTLNYGGLFFADGTGADAYRGYVQYNHDYLGIVDTLLFGVAGAQRYSIDATGVSTWSVGGSTAMTLNSTGLGVGVTPSAKFHSKAGAVTLGGIIETGGANALLSFADSATSSYTRVQIGSSGNNLVALINGSTALTLNSSNSLVLGSAAIATTATDGFLYIPGCAGTPTGTPTSQTGRVPLVVDTTNNKLYFYSGGSWVAAN